MALSDDDDELKNRKVKHFGFAFNYKTNDIGKFYLNT